MTTNRLIVLVPIRLTSRANERGNWRKQWRLDKHQKQVVGMAVKAQLPRKHAPPYVVKLTRLGPRTLDWDNAVGACKGAIDAVAEVLGVDDGDRAAVRWDVDQETSPDYGVRIEVSWGL